VHLTLSTSVSKVRFYSFDLFIRHFKYIAAR
jgi:hypothetical protein